MLVDQFPELKELAPNQQLQLASELASHAVRSGDLHDLSQQSVNLLEHQLKQIISDPSKGTNWQDLRGSRND